MSFNLKEFMTRTAGKTNLNTTTEGQFAKPKGQVPSQTQEAQLEKARGKDSAVALSEKQLESVRTKKDAPTQTTEVQLDRKDNTPNATSEKQLDESRQDGSMAPVEKRLDKVRESTFNLSSFLGKTAKKEKKDKTNATTEAQLGERGEKEPKELPEAQLQHERFQKAISTVEQQLESVRTGEAHKLTEAQMDESKSKLVQHRNSDTSAGDIPKLEEQRLAAKTTQEGEKYEAASETDKKLMLPKVEGKDGLKTASAAPLPGQFGQGLNAEAMNMLKQYDIKPTDLFRFDTDQTPFKDIYMGIQEAKKGNNTALKTALEKRFGHNGWWQRRLSGLPAGAVGKSAYRYDEPFNVGGIEFDSPNMFDDSTPFKSVMPDVDALADDMAKHKGRRTMEEAALAEGATKGVKPPSESEVSKINESYGDESDEKLPEEIGDDGLPVDDKIAEDNSQDIQVGSSIMRQITLSFDPSEFESDNDVKTEATSYLLSSYPSLFSFKVGKYPIEIGKSISVMMADGKAVAMLPIAAFKSVNKPTNDSEAA